MKKWLLIIFLFWDIQGHTQGNDPVNWKVSYVPTGALTGEIHLIATIEKPWHIYAQQQPKQSISKPTQIKFNHHSLVVLVGTPKEVGHKELYDNKEIGVVQYQYGERVEFVQSVKLKAKVKTKIAGSVSYQCCNDEKCLPVVNYSFTCEIQ